MTTCNKGSIIDVDCVYEDGKFIIGGTDACLPEIFTVRFRAPADYKAGDVIVFREKELPVRTPGMASATTDIFKTGAIVHADIDLVSRRAFVWMGGAGGVLPNMSYEEQFAGFYDVDGSKVYVKMFGPYKIPTNSYYNTPHNVPSIKRILKYEARTEENQDVTMSSNYASGTWWWGFAVNPTRIHCRAGNIPNTYETTYTLYYTCTDR